MKLTHCGITIEVNAIDAQRYLAAGYKPVEELVEIPAPPEPSLKGGRPEAVEEPKARISAKKKG